MYSPLIDQDPCQAPVPALAQVTAEAETDAETEQTSDHSTYKGEQLYWPLIGQCDVILASDWSIRCNTVL